MRKINVYLFRPADRQTVVMICFMWVVVGPNFIDVQFYLRQQTDRLGDIIHVTGDTYANVDRAIFHHRHKSVIL